MAIEREIAAWRLGFESTRFEKAVCPFTIAQPTLRKAWKEGRRKAVHPKSLKVTWSRNGIRQKKMEASHG